MSMPSKEEILVVVQRYTRDVVILALLPQDIPDGYSVPDEWKAILQEQAAGKKTWLSLWQDYNNVLPETFAFLRDKVKGVAVLITQSQPPMLLYVYSKGVNNYLYKGFPPVIEAPNQDSIPFWQCMPDMLKHFYTHVHNGWVQYASDAIGPLPLQGVFPLTDPDFDVSADVEAQLPFDLNRVFAVFSNGGGDYLAIDCDKVPDSNTYGIIWWHEKPLEAEVNLDFWAYLDGWISGQVEDMDKA